MIPNTARFLSRTRLNLLLRGLRLRMAAGTEKLGRELDELRAELAQTEKTARENAEITDARFEQQRVAAITAWDERRMGAWDDAERRAFHAVHSAAAQESSLRTDSRRQSDELTVQAKARIADIEKRFLRSKDKTVAKLSLLKEQIERLAGQLAIVEQETITFLAQRGVAVQPTQRARLEQPPGTAAKTIELCTQQIVRSRQLLAALAQNRISRAIESFWFWLLCSALGAITTAVLGLLGVLPWPFAVVTGIITAVMLGVIALVAVHPWIRRHLRAEYPRLEAALSEAGALRHLALQQAVAENDAGLRRLAEKRDNRMREAVLLRDQALKELNAHIKAEMSRLRQYAANERAAVKQQLTHALARVDEQGESEQVTSSETFAVAQAELRAQLVVDCNRLGEQIRSIELHGNQRIRAAAQRAAIWLARSRRWSQIHFPPWEQIASDEPWTHSSNRPVLPLGTLQVDSFMPESVRLDAGGALAVPVNFEAFQDNYLTITGDRNSRACQQLVQTLVLRALTTLPPGKTQVAIIDPPGLGRDYGWLMHLSDYDPELVSHRVWTQPNHIAKHVTQLALKAEDFIQQALRNQYATIEEYNRDAGPLAEPYRILIWTAFPLGLDDQSWKPLQSLLDTGARCGIIPILVLDPAQPWDQPEQRELLLRRGLHLTVTEDRVHITGSPSELTEVPIEPLPPPGEEVTRSLIHQVGRRARLASRVEVPLARIAPPRDQWWQADSSAALEIPVGQSGVGRIQSLKLGVGTAQHAIVAGKTGSGKSTLLHAIITSAAVKYSPERLRLVLLDFKKGVEFQAYSQSQFPHADIIGIESQREFGLSALEYVDQCLQHRGRMFRDAGVQDMRSWNLLHPQQQMPRMLIVIDEFQELFVEDDKLTSQVSLILDRIVRQGRSFGVHAVLSSQTLAGAYSLPRTTLGQMAVRIALQCDAADAQLIFADDNPAASRLHHPGQAVYNDQGGRVEGNQAMQIGWLNKQDITEWLGELPSRGYRNTDISSNSLGRAVVFDGNRAATWNAEAAKRALDAARSEFSADACWCIVGDSVAISPAVAIPLTDQAGRNMMIVGGEDALAASVVLSIAGSFVAHHATRQHPLLTLIQGAKPTDAKCLSLPKRLGELSTQVQVADSRGADALLNELHATLNRRIEAPDGYAQWQPIMLIILNIGRLRTLRPDDEFGMGSFGESKMTPDKQLEELLRDGPSHHIHVVIWSENANTIGRWLGRAALREIEIRLLMQMSANDSTHLIDSVAAAHLGQHVMLLHDDATSTEVRFRPYDVESLVDLVGFVRPTGSSGTACISSQAVREVGSPSPPAPLPEGGRGEQKT